MPSMFCNREKRLCSQSAVDGALNKNFARGRYAVFFTRPRSNNLFFPNSEPRMRTEMGKKQENIPEGVVGRWVFVSGKSGAPSPARGIIILVTRRPKFSDIFELSRF